MSKLLSTRPQDIEQLCKAGLMSKPPFHNQ